MWSMKRRVGCPCTVRRRGFCEPSRDSDAILRRREKQREYRLRNKEILREKQKQYRQKNQERIREKLKIYREINRETLREQKRKYKEKHKDKIREQQKEYVEKNKEKIRERQKKYAQEKKEILRVRQKEYAEKNKEKIHERQKKYRIKNRDSKRKTQKEYVLRNKEKLKQKQKEYLLRNKELVRERQKKYSRENRDRLREYRIRNKEQIRKQQKEYRLEKKKRLRFVRKYTDWKSPEEVRQFFEKVKEKLHIHDSSDWYRISQPQLRIRGGSGVYYTHKTLGNALKFAYPEIDWDLKKFSFRGKKSTQRWLRVMVESLLPEKCEIFEDFLHPDLVWENTRNLRMELDLWIPKYNLALEYQGEHHYYDIQAAYGPGTTELYARRDFKKKKACEEKGITLATIPYWWKEDKESLSATLHLLCPNVFPKIEGTVPIPDNPPSTKNKKGLIPIKQPESE